MSLLINWIISTIVLTQVHASPVGSLVPEKNSVNPTDKTVHEIPTEDVNISNVTVPTNNEKKIKYYPYLQAASPRLGLMFNSKNIKEPGYFMGFTYMLPKRKSPQLEVGFDLLNDNTGFLHLTKRYVINERQYFRPFYKWGAALLLEPEQKLAGLLAFSNYYGRVSVGLEDLLKPPMSIRLELEASIGAKAYVSVNFGYSWGF